MPKKPVIQSREMFATDNFFTKPGIAEKLLRDAGIQFYHTVPVIVIRMDDVAKIKDAVRKKLARGPAFSCVEGAAWVTLEVLGILPPGQKR